MKQHKLLVEAVKKGAGFMMLGGRSSFGAGGWAGTAIEPRSSRLSSIRVTVELEPDQGIKFVPTPLGLDSFVLQVGANRAETAKIWAVDAADPGSQPLRRAEGARPQVLATSPAPERRAPDARASTLGNSRTIAYGGDTWVWARSSEEGRLAHRKLWRQLIFWLSHKENDSENHVKLTLDRRRVAVGEKIELSATARDSKGTAIPNVRYETKIEREGPEPSPEPVDLYDQGDEARGPHYATEKIGQPGNYTVSTIARANGPEIGRDKARFLVYQDDRELENPSADLKLAREIAEITGGEAVTPRTVGKLLERDRPLRLTPST